MTSTNQELSGLRADLASGVEILATFVIVPRLEIVEILSVAGFNAVILDCEHGPFGVETLQPIVAAAKGAGLWALIRVRSHDASEIGAALDLGADGVVVPNVANAETARDVVRAARFSPEGSRGANPYVRAAKYSAADAYFTTAGSRTAVVVMIEGSEALDSLDEILAVPGLDAVFVGPVDLSASLGLTGQTEHPRVVEAATRVIRLSAERRVATAMFAASPESGARWLSMGVTMLALSVDTGMMLHGFREFVSALRKEAKQ